MSTPHSQTVESSGNTMDTDSSSDNEYYDAGWEDESETDEDITGVHIMPVIRKTPSARLSDIPEELLIEIFVTAHHSFGTFQDAMRGPSAEGIHHYARWEKDTVSFLLAICSVCSRWRQTALSATELWSTISLARLSEATYELVCGRLATFVERSGARPLELFIAQCDKEEEGTHSQPAARLWESAGRILIAQVNRCAFFHYYAASESFATLLPLPGRLEHLMGLNIYISTSTPPLRILGPDNEAPLRRVEVSVRTGAVTSLFDHARTEAILDLRLRLPYHNNIHFGENGFITEDTAASLTWALTAKVIAGCSNLTRLAIACSRAPEDLMPISTVPHLNYLSLTDNLAIGLGKYISAPALTHLTLTYVDNWGSRLQDDYPTSFPNLESLEIEAVSSVYSNLAKLHRLIRRQPNLRTLSMSWITYGDVVLLVRLLRNDVFRPWMTLRADPAPQDWEGPFVSELSCVRLASIYLPHKPPAKEELSDEISALMEQRGQLRFEYDSTMFKQTPESLEKLQVRWGDRLIRMTSCVVKDPMGGWIRRE